MKLTFLAALGLVRAQDYGDWVPIVCTSNDDCMDQSIVDQLNAEYETDYGMENTVCADLIYGEGEDDPGYVLTPFCEFEAFCETEDWDQDTPDADDWWFVYCGDEEWSGASNLVAASTAAFMLAYSL